MKYFINRIFNVQDKYKTITIKSAPGKKGKDLQLFLSQKLVRVA